MTSPRIVPVPVEPTDEERAASKKAFNGFRREWNDWCWEHGGTEEPIENRVARFMMSRAPASPPPPVAGAEALVPGHEAFRRRALAKAANLDAADLIGDPVPNEETIEGLAATLAIIAVGREWTINDDGYLSGCVAGDQGYALTSIKVDRPPPPADLKAEPVAWIVEYRNPYDQSWSGRQLTINPAPEAWPTDSYRQSPLYPASALSAASAAGKAEGVAEIRRLKFQLSGMMAARDALKAETRATARAEALGEALTIIRKALRKARPGAYAGDPSDVAEASALEEIEDAIRALQPLPPRKEFPRMSEAELIEELDRKWGPLPPDEEPGKQ